MNDADWLRKHLRGKVQRSAVEGGDQGLLRRLVYRTLRRLRSAARPKTSEPPAPPPEPEPE